MLARCLCLLAVCAHPAHAEENHAHHDPDQPSALADHHQHPAASLSASIGMLVADYDARLFSGDYQGVFVGAQWTHRRFGLAVTVPAYRLTKNGRAIDGVGDVMAHGHVSLLHRGPWSLGLAMMATAPTGNGDAGLGMGHAMLMPEVWGGWTSGRLALMSSLGVGYAAGGAAAHAEHGEPMWPLVDPMNATELTFRGGTMLGLARELAAGVGVRGARPMGDGTTRLVTAVRIVWVAGRAATSFEIQHGTVGDPFGLRGIVETAIRLR